MALQKGDRIRLQFAASQWSWMRAWQIMQIEDQLESSSASAAFTLISADYWQDYHVIFTIEILNPVTAAGEIIDQKRIIKYILAANPTGYALAFEKEIIEPIVAAMKEAAAAVAPWAGMTGVIIILVLILLLQRK
jgi:hypothetical protein